MRRASYSIVLVLILLLGTALTASAGTATGSTVLLGAPTSGQSVDVDVSVVSDTPVVAYEYSMVNACAFDGKFNGQGDSYQRDDIVNWVYSSPAPYGSVPHATMTVYLNTVPTGSLCKVFLVKNNTVVKGSTTFYTVQ